MKTPGESIRVLIAEKDAEVAKTLRDLLQSRGYDAHFVTTLTELRSRLQRDLFDVALTDVALTDGDRKDRNGDAASICMEADPAMAVLVLAPVNSRAIDAAGTIAPRNALAKPVRSDDLVAAIDRALESSRLHREARTLRTRLGIDRTFRAIVGSSSGLTERIHRSMTLADSDLPILIVGENGVGKELLAEAIHAASPRSGREMVTALISSEPLDLQLSALFGHVRGAFTNACTARHGWFRQAHGATLFLDEIGEVTLETQVAMLRALDKKRVRAIGADSEEPVDVRVISATNRDLEADVRSNRFRRDFYQRLGGSDAIELPPLRERREDIPMLLDHFLQASAGPGRPVPSIESDVIDALCEYDWPGNIRELRYKAEVAVKMAGEGPVAARHFRLGKAPGEEQAGASPDGWFALPFKKARAAFSAEYMRRLVASCGGSKTKAASVAGVDVSTVSRTLSGERGADESPSSDE